MENTARFNIAGKIIEICDEQVFASGFVKRDMIVETTRNEAYPSPVKVTFKKDDCAICNTLHVGDGVTVEGFVEGRRWDGPKGAQYFIDLSAKKVDVVEKAPEAEKPTKAANWDEFVALAAAYGLDKAKATEKAKAYGKAFREMKDEDWQKLADEVVAENAPHEQATIDDSDDMPF